MKLSADIIAVLDEATIKGNTLVLPGKPGDSTIPRALYLKVNQAIELLGGRWSSKAKCHVFDENPDEAIADAITMGSVEDRKKAMQYFKTPDALARRLVKLAAVCDHEKVLEPSAGDGVIVRAIRAAAPEARIMAIEIDNLWIEAILRSGAHDGMRADFLAVNPLQYQGMRYDAIVANPPFSKQQDVDHVLHMYKFLKPAGRLVSVMSANAIERRNGKGKTFREFVERTGGQIEKLPTGSFRESGTMVETCVLVVEKEVG